MNILTILIVIAVCCFLFVWLNSLYKKTNGFKNNELIHCSDSDFRSEADVMILGSTYGRFGFGTASETNIRASDLTASPRSFEMDNLFFDRYISDSKALKSVILNVTACSVLYTEPWTDNYYYDVLDKKIIKNYSWFRKLERKFPLLRHPKSVARIIKDVKPFHNLYEMGEKNDENTSNELILKNLCDNWIKIFSLHDLKSGDLSAENKAIIDTNMEYLKKIIDGCLNKDIHPIIVIPPFSSELNRYFGNDFIEETTGYVTKALKDCYGDKILILNYQFDKVFESPELYIDGGFRLSQVGSRLLVNTVFSYI